MSATIPIVVPAQRAPAHRHRLVVQTAMEMAGELYEEVMRDNELFAHWKRLCPELTPAILHERFCVLMTPHLLDPARATLAGMLATPINEDLKSTIFDALINDASLRRGNRAARRRMKHQGTP